MAVRVKKLPVPEVTGLRLPVADKVLKAAGFPGGRVHYVESYEPSGTVIGQDPPRGTLLEATRKVTVRIAKSSLIRYLPTVYQPRQPGDRMFLQDFLWIFQHLFDGVSATIDEVPNLFNPFTTPPEFLSWLASWFAIAFDQNMPDARRRRVLKEAIQLFRLRGTREAIERMVKLFLDLDVKIEENRWPYRGFRIGVESEIGVNTMILPEISMSHTFVVRVPKSFGEVGEDRLIRLHQVIETEKPASSNYFLQFQGEEGVSEYEGFMRIGLGMGIGVEFMEWAGIGVGVEAVEEPGAEAPGVA